MVCFLPFPWTSHITFCANDKDRQSRSFATQTGIQWWDFEMSAQSEKSKAEGLGSAIGFGLGVLLADYYFNTGTYSYAIHALFVIFGMISGAYAGKFFYQALGAKTRNDVGRIATASYVIRALLALFCVALGLGWMFAYLHIGKATNLMMGSILLALGFLGFPPLEKTIIPVSAGLVALSLNAYLMLAHGPSLMLVIGIWISAGLTYHGVCASTV